MDLSETLARFDGKHVDELRAASEGLDASELAALPKFCRGEHAVAATWMVKLLIEANRVNLLAEAMECLHADMPWEAQLHLLQCVQHAPDVAITKVSVIRQLMDHPKTLLRVWALDALVRIWTVEPALAVEAPKLVENALNDKAASVRARARQLAKITGGQP